MCKAPNILADGTEVACRNCSLCRDRAINDWVGRNIAESKTAVASHAVTLTYGRNGANDVDHERASVLTYSDVQKFIKLLRFHGYPVRYFVTGEFGSKKGRAHWHLMLYWQEKVPDHVLGKNFMQEHWPHGWSFWAKPDPHAVRYNCKYIQKDMGEAERQGHLAMSKKPPLGTAFFKKTAEQYVTQGLSPQDLFYRFPDVKRTKRDGSEEIIPFMLKDRPAEMFLEHFIATWREKHGNRPWPPSQLLTHFLETEDERELRRLSERLEAAGPHELWTPAVKVQCRKDMDALDTLRRRMEKAKAAADWMVEKPRQMNPVTRSGVRTMQEWNDEMRERDGQQ